MTDELQVVQVDMGIAAPSWQMADIPLYRIMPDEAILAPRPERGFIEDIQRRGLTTPVALCPADPGRGYDYEIVAGRRRVMAFRKLLAAGMQRFATIPAIIFADVSAYEAALMASSENNKRTQNKLQDVVAIKQALEKTAVDPKTKDGLALLAKETGIAINTLKKRLKLAQVERGFIQAVVDGKVPIGALDTLALLSPKQRLPLLNKLQANGKLAQKDVDEAKAMQVAGRLAEQQVVNLPGFDDLPDIPMPGEPVESEPAVIYSRRMDEFEVELGVDYVRILDLEGVQITRWDLPEWAADASVTLEMCAAIKTAYENGVDAMLALLCGQ